jgi:enoyl-CoA hydratase/carnithine racemase
MSDELLQVTADGGVVTVTIDHPPKQLVDAPFVGALIGLLDRLEDDDAVRVVVLRSADPDFFLMHGDVELLLASRPLPAQPDAPNVAAATFQRFSAAHFVTIAAIDGAARGGGAELLTALDLRFGTPRTVLGQPEVPLGILPGAGGTARLPRLLGRARALELILTSRDVGADEAVELGWLNAVLPDRDALDRHVTAIAARIAAMPPGAVAEVKRVVDVSLGAITPALAEETAAYARLTADGAHRPFMRRFLDAGGQTRDGELGDFQATLGIPPLP